MYSKYVFYIGQSPMQITQFEPLLPSEHPVASVRLLKLLAGRGLEKVSEVIVGHDYGNVGKGDKGGKAGQDVIDDDEEEDEKDDDEEEEGGEVDMEDSDEDSSVEGNNDTEDKIVGLQWSDDDE
jgi:hypothetical protein